MLQNIKASLSRPSTIGDIPHFDLLIIRIMEDNIERNYMRIKPT
jgi:hypothetical protein